MLALAAEPSRISGVVLSTVEPHVCAPIDANGNLTADGTKTYFWNALNQLVEVKEGTTTIATFEYDGDGRRTEKVAAGLTHQYIYDAGDIVEDRITGSSSDTIRYYHGAGIDEPLARTNGSSVTTYYLADHLGSIVQETNASGAVTLEREYDPWGVLAQGASASGYAFTSREWDSEIGLYFYRARYYRPESGRFLSDDPFGFVDGPNLGGYVRNNPVSFKDPSGNSTLALDMIRIVTTVGTGAALAAPPTWVVVATVGAVVVVGGAIWMASQRNPWEGVPGSTVEIPNQTRRYGPDGYPETDVDTGHDHGAGDPHAHDIGRPADGSPPTAADRLPKGGRPLKPGDPHPPKGKNPMGGSEPPTSCKK